MGRTDLDAAVLTISRTEEREFGDVVLFREGSVHIAGAPGARLAKIGLQQAGLVLPLGAEDPC